MGAAKNEAEVLTHMGVCFERSGGKIGPASDSAWSIVKAEALEAIEREVGRVEVVTDVGIGDLTPIERWVERRGGWPERYLGVDGCREVLEAARRRHPERLFVERTFEEFLGTAAPYDRIGGPKAADVRLLFDVLYHVPSDETCRALFDWATQAVLGFALTYATNAQGFGGQRPGEAGFAWFPRPEIGQWLADLDGWRLVHQNADFRAGPQQQRLVAYVREG